MTALFVIRWRYLDDKARRDETSYMISNYTEWKVKKTDKNIKV